MSIATVSPETAIVVLCTAESESSVHELLGAGAVSYCRKEVSAALLAICRCTNSDRAADWVMMPRRISSRYALAVAEIDSFTDKDQSTNRKRDRTDLRCMEFRAPPRIWEHALTSETLTIAPARVISRRLSHASKDGCSIGRNARLSTAR